MKLYFLRFSCTLICIGLLGFVLGQEPELPEVAAVGITSVEGLGFQEERGQLVYQYLSNRTQYLGIASPAGYKRIELSNWPRWIRLPQLKNAEVLTLLEATPEGPWEQIVFGYEGSPVAVIVNNIPKARVVGNWQLQRAESELDFVLTDGASSFTFGVSETARIIDDTGVSWCLSLIEASLPAAGNDRIATENENAKFDYLLVREDLRACNQLR